MRSSVVLLTFLGASWLYAQEGAPALGVAHGELKYGGTQAALKVAKAHLHDNREGLLDSPKELRILLTDREVPAGSLDGLVFLPVDRLAREGRVQGLLIKMNPADRTQAYVTVLWQPAVPGDSLLTQTLMNTGKGVFRRLQLDGDRISGELIGEPSSSEDSHPLDYHVAFTAQVEPEPAVTADLRGPAAQGSPQVKALKASVQAILQGDPGKARAYRTDLKNSEVDGFLAQAGAQGTALLKQMTQELARTLKEVDRVVVRGDHALVLWRKGGQSVSFARVDGTWKMD